MTKTMNQASRSMNKNQIEKFRVSQKIVLYNPLDKTFLLLKDSDPTSGVSKKYGTWELPGGRIDENEAPEDNLEREIKEEIGSDVEYSVHNLVGKYFFTVPDENRVGLAYLGTYKGGELHLSDEHSEYRWNTLEEIEKNKEYYQWLKDIIRNAAEYIKNESYLTDLKRLQADFENYKKRQVESQKDLRGILIEKLVLDIIPVLDNFRSATQHVPPEQKESPWVVGIQYIEKQLETVLTDNGMQVIEAKEGDIFDPSMHEALDSEQSTDNSSTSEVGSKQEDEAHVIAKVIQKGYKFGDRVIRPVKVIVR